MSFNISTFSTHINNSGTLQNNRFECNIPVPPAIQGQNFILPIDQLLMFRAEHIVVPGVSLESVDNHTAGVGVTTMFPTNVRFNKTRITFLENKTNDVLKFFYLWTSATFDYTGDTNNSPGLPTYTTQYRNLLAVDIGVSIFNNKSDIISKIVMVGAIPTAIDDYSLDWGDTNKNLRITVEFSFKHWHMNSQ